MKNICEKFKSIMSRESILKYVISGGIILAFVCFLEIFLFNYRHWQSLGNEPIPLAPTLSDELAVADYNAFSVLYLDDTYPYIEVTGLDNPVQNITADYTFPLQGPYAVREVNYYIEITDEGNSYPYSFHDRTFMHLVPQSCYNYINAYGNLRSFRIYFTNLNEGDIVRYDSLVLNAVVPMLFSKKRVLALAFFIFIMFLLRPHSFLYDINISEKKGIKGKIKIASIIAMLCLQIIFVNWAIRLNTAFYDQVGTSERQFMHLAEALAQGQTHLLINPPEALKSLDDPYDYNNRRLTCAGSTDGELLWDVAYYDGNYYVYFGIAPIVAFYLPYYLITGTHVRTINVVFINLIFAVIGVAMLLYEMARRWYPKLPLSVYLMFSNMFAFGCGLIYLVMKADFYAVPLAMAVALCMWGLFCWLRAIDSETGKINPWLIALGSFLLALESATRPQFLLASFAAFLIFWNAVFKERTLFSKKSIGATVGFVAPYVVVAALVMYYNAVRFGSPFDFGANYNLTFNNMPYRGFRLDRLIYSTFGYLFTPCSVSNKFPFFDMANLDSTYQGHFSDEYLMGGVIYNNIILAVTLFGFKFRKVINNKFRYIFVCLAPLLTMFVGFVDGNMAGVLIRYHNDLAWYMFISGFIIIGALICREIDEKDNIAKLTLDAPKEFLSKYGPDKNLAILYYSVWVCFGVSFVRNFLNLFAGNGNPQGNMQPFWQMMSHLVEFWH